MDFDPGFIGPLWHVLGLAQMLTTDIDRIVRSTGLSAADLALLGTIRIAAPDVLRSTDLAAKLHVSAAALSARIARLEHLGLVRRRGQEGDRRALEVILTEAGEAMSDETTHAVSDEAAFARRFRALPQEEQAALASILGKLHDLVDRDYLPTNR
ncbi:MarR family transcriptional regulator (plasmid) [Novosphingobium sp. BL-8A]